jgi:putative flavoprotein involved in K+ transport
MRKTTTVIIGAGQAGLAMSRCLTRRSIDHVVLERGEVANSWRTERWDSLRLLTPNWQSRLPDYTYEGDDPDGYMDMAEVVRFLDRYAQVTAAPVQANTRVLNVTPVDDGRGGYQVVTDQGTWRCRTLVIATGACNIASVPRIAGDLPGNIQSLTPMQYRNPGQLEDSGVLVVGASATGVQLAKEIHESGRPVTLAVGEHVRAPRTYRGRDIKWWMDAAGILDMTWREVDDIGRARNVPSLQLVGGADRATLDLNTLSDLGVRLAGRLAGIHEGKAQFSGSLGNVCALADLKMNRLLDSIDQWAAEAGFDDVPDVLQGPVRFDATRVSERPELGLNLKDNIRTVLWATGYRPDYSWLNVPVLDRRGRLRHDAGVVEAPGMYVLGLPFLRRRKSSLIDGAGDDARDLSEHLAGYLSDWRMAA